MKWRKTSPTTSSRRRTSYEQSVCEAGRGQADQLDGSTRRVILDLPELMLVEFTFEEGAVGALHSHPHMQTSYVAEGTFEVTIDGVTETIAPGGAYIVPSGWFTG